MADMYFDGNLERVITSSTNPNNATVAILSRNDSILLSI